MNKSLRKMLFSIALALVMMVAFSLRHSLADDTDSRFLLFTGFNGTSNDAGWIFKLDTSGGYQFNRYFEITAGLPVYFVQASSETSEDILEDSTSSKAGIGDVYVDVRFKVTESDFYFSSSLRGTAPTGNEEDGFSTGQMTVDWNNYFEYGTEQWSPFISAGIANSISDTRFFSRPFTSLGLVGQFEGGLLFYPDGWISLGGSGYAILPSGEQKIYGRMSGRRGPGAGSGPGAGAQGVSISGNSRRGNESPENSDPNYYEGDVEKDYGFSGWVDVYPLPDMVLEFGFSRSISYEHNNFFFSVRFDLAGMMRKDSDW